MTTQHRGPYGHAELIPMPDIPEAAESVCSWLITAPYAHPAWTQYQLAVVRLRDNVPGFTPPYRQFLGATHELLILACDPDHGPWTVATALQAIHAGRGIPWLRPVNLVLQFEARDDEMRECASLSVRAIVNGHMLPEAPLGRESFTAGWLQSWTKALAHVRGEEHAP